MSWIETESSYINRSDVEQSVQAMAGFSQPNMDSITEDVWLDKRLHYTLRDVWHAKT